MIYALIVLAIILVFAVGVYNGLIKLKNKVNEAWADIDTQLKRRYDLIPNFVETVKGYASHEAGTLEKVVQARTQAMGAQNPKDKEAAENMLSQTLKSIFALAENYPELKANQNFLELQKALKEIEEHIQLSRRYYNATVRDFNTKIQVFPNNLLAGILGFIKRDFFQADDSEKENVKVSFQKTDEAPAETPAEAPTPQVPETPETPAPTPETPEAPNEEQAPTPPQA
ncbi:LemA family protein [Candidatus Gracilibacteria bacterium]|nr:LemA family protein [Candidatus Gracilibacteria bacterium]